MIVLDTHCVLWWLGDPARLSRSAKQAIEKAAAENAALVSAISAWEIAMLVLRRRLELSISVEEWIARAEAVPGLRFVPVNQRIAVRAVELPGSFHSDPADRIIIATALLQQAEVVSKDEKLRRYGHIRAVW